MVALIPLPSHLKLFIETQQFLLEKLSPWELGQFSDFGTRQVQMLLRNKLNNQEADNCKIRTKNFLITVWLNFTLKLKLPPGSKACQLVLKKSYNICEYSFLPYKCTFCPVLQLAITSPWVFHTEMNMFSPCLLYCHMIVHICL